MSVRKMLMVCAVAMAVILPLFGCNGGGTDSGTGSGGGSSSNTTNAE